MIALRIMFILSLPEFLCDLQTFSNKLAENFLAGNNEKLLVLNMSVKNHFFFRYKILQCENNNQIIHLKNEMHLQYILRSYTKVCNSANGTIVKKSASKMLESSNLPFTVIVEGNIGSGKTTFLKNFINNRNVLTLTEPVENWKNVGGHNLLELLYGDIKSWAFTFQTYVQLTMMKLHEEKTNRPVKIIERSIYSARNIFIENLYQMNILSPPEVAVLDEWYKWLLQKREFSVNLIVYLRTDPEVAFQRIKERSRPGEHLISLEYIKKLHECHEDWLCRKTKFVRPASVLLLDANKNLSDIKEEYNYFQNQVALLTSNETS